jgi:dTDP-4-dehydrorhamnose reductase
MKIYIFGSTGMMGNYIQKYLSTKYDIISITKNEINILNVTHDSLDMFISNYNPNPNDIVINCMGIIPHTTTDNVNNARSFIIINSLFPIMLSFMCKKYNMKFIHITTDCVFSGSSGNYNEDDISDENKMYGMSKSLGELACGTIIRTSVIGEENKKKNQFLEWVRNNKNKEITGYDNHYWNGVTCLQLAKIINQIIDKDMYWNGVRHIFSPNIVSKFQLANIINDIYNLNINIKKFITDCNIDKTLSTIYEINNMFNIPDLTNQIIELKNYTKI